MPYHIIIITTHLRQHPQQTPTTNMKLLLAVLAALVAMTLAKPQSPKDAVITAYSNDNIGIDGYNFAFQTSDGISRSEQGTLKNPGTDGEAIEVRGSYTFRADDGKEYTVNFVADENGYRPSIPAATGKR